MQLVHIQARQRCCHGIAAAGLKPIAQNRSAEHKLSDEGNERDQKNHVGNRAHASLADGKHEGVFAEIDGVALGNNQCKAAADIGYTHSDNKGREPKLGGCNAVHRANTGGQSQCSKKRHDAAVCSIVNNTQNNGGKAHIVGN